MPHRRRILVQCRSPSFKDDHRHSKSWGCCSWSH